jgi:hypothetical protein
MAHTYDKIRLKELLGVSVDVDTHDTFEKLANEILVQKIKIASYIDKGVWTNPNSIMLLKKCGFKFVNVDKTKSIYDMKYSDDTIGLKLLPQVYYTNKILSLMKNDSYFKENYYKDDVFINDEFIKTEKRIHNSESDYGKDKRCDIGICSAEHEKYIIGIEINENRHKSKQDQDKKRCDDLLYRYGSNGFKIMKIFNLRLNKENNVRSGELKEMCGDIIDSIKKLDSMFDKKRFTIKYLVNHGLGDEEFCTLLVNSHTERKYIEFSNVYTIIKDKIKSEYVETIEKDFTKWHKDHLKQMEDYCYANSMTNKNKTNALFDDTDSDSENDSNSVDSSDASTKSEDCTQHLKIMKIKDMCSYTHGVLKLTFNGMVRFFQYLEKHPEYFKFVTDYDFVLQYTINASNCMMFAISELFEVTYDFLNDRKIVDYGDY